MMIKGSTKDSRQGAGCSDKLTVNEQLKVKLSLINEQSAYMGNDFPDAPVMQQVGLAIAVADAHPEASVPTDYTPNSSGRKGTAATREIYAVLMASSR